MASLPYLVALPNDSAASPARTLINGIVAATINAETSADAVALMQAQYANDVDAMWTQATATQVAATANMAGWNFRLKIAAVDGSLSFDQTVTADGVATTAAIAASKNLVSSATYGNGETVTVGGKTYTFQTALTNVANNVLIGVSEATAMANLVAAITGGAGSGTTYAALTVTNVNVTASTDGVHTITATALVPGVAGNSIAISEAAANAAWAGAATTLSGGADAVVDNVSALAAKMVAKLNASGTGIANAAFNSGTRVLTVAGAADGIGDHRVFPYFLYPKSKELVGVPGYIASKVDTGSAGAALTITLAADTYTPVTIVALLGSAVV